VAGTAWAQPTGLNPSGATTGEMGLTYSVNNIAELSVDAKNPTEAELSADVSAVTVGNFGNLGTVTVKTNATAWDILVKTDNGGRLIDAASGVVESSAVTNAWGDTTGWDLTYKGANCLVYKSATGSATSANGLLASTTASKPDTVLLKVAVGVAKTGKALGATGANAGKLYPMSNVTSTTVTPVAPVEVGFLDILKSKSLVDAAYTTAYGGARANISLAKVIGTGYGSAGTAPTGDYSNSILGGGATPAGREWGDIATYGFPKPSGNVEELEEHFYINVQVDETLGDGLGANKSGNYSEKFYFDLAVNF